MYNQIFLKIAAGAAFSSAVTTFLLWLLPHLYNAPASFEEGVLLHQNFYYMAKQWVNLLHIPLALTAYFGLCLVSYKRRFGLSLFGMMWFSIWGAIEMIGVSIILISVNYNWRSGYQQANDLNKAVLKNNIETFYSVWDSMFLVLLIAFLLGTLFFAWATWKSSGLKKVLSYLLWLAVPLTVLIILSGYAGQEWAGQATQYLYPILQPCSRALLGMVLWQASKPEGSK